MEVGRWGKSQEVRKHYNKREREEIKYKQEKHAKELVCKRNREILEKEKNRNVGGDPCCFSGVI